MMLSWKRLSIYPKLVSALLCVILPIYMLSMQMNRSSQAVVERQLSQTLESQVHFYLSSMETEISRLIRLKFEYSNDNEILALSTAINMLSDYEKLQAIRSVKNKLALLQHSTPYVEEVKMQIPMLGRSIVASSFDDRISEDELDALKDVNNVNASIFSFQGRLFTSEIYPAVHYEGREPVITMGIELSVKQIRNTLSSIEKNKQGGAALISAQHGWMVSDGADEAIPEELRTLFEADGSRAEANGQERISLKGHSYFIAYEYSPVLQTSLVVYRPIEQMIQPLQRYSKSLWALSVLSVALVAVFSYWIYLLIHRPLRRLVQAFKKVEEGYLGVTVHHHQFDEFYYLYGQFNYMVKRIRV